jgi:preprotein translocase subunit SecA
MVLKLAAKILGTPNDRALKKYGCQVPLINALEERFAAMDDAELQNQTVVFRERLANGETTDDILHEAFAVVREATKRVLGQRHYDVQLIGGLVLNDGLISEMRTGEGKTQVAALAVYLNALPAKGVHVVTVNDYLASRDAEWMGQIYGFLGMTTGCVIGGTKDEDRRNAYACDVTYGTNNEFGFDYLRDNMKYSLEQMVQRPFHFAIVDEVDSILIDEARTPLIISGPSESNTELYIAANKIIPELDVEDFEIDEKHKTVVLNEEGTEHVEKLLEQHGLLSDGGLYDIQNIGLIHHVNQALRANKLFTADKDYIVKDGRVVLIDEFTGRMMDGRRLSDGLHQAIEAKEGVDVQNENQTLASVTFQNYFRLYPKLAGMTGTALTEADEFSDIYDLGVIDIPTHIPVARIDHEDKIYKSQDDKANAIIALIKECQARDQPVLVGTVSIENSEDLSSALKKAKITHNVLNARHHEQEAFIIAQAGRPGAVTIATNMAGRGTDIKLGGNLDMRIEAEIDEKLSDDKKQKILEKIIAEIEVDKAKVLEAGGLYVVGTERHESRRIDNQLRGRSGRQGDPGASMFFLSVDDDLMRIFAGDKLEGLLANSKMGLREGESLEHPLISKMLERAQAKVESMHYEVRKNLLKYDNVMNDQRKVIYDQRKGVMESDNVSTLVKDMRHELVEDIVADAIPPGSYAEKWDLDYLGTESRSLLALDIPVHDWAKEDGIADQEMEERIIDASDRKMAEKAVHIGSDNWRRVEKNILLQFLDQNWKEHLLNLDHLRQGINLRAFGQRDPLNEYKTEAFSMFEKMLDQMSENVVQTLSFLEFSNQDDGKIGLIIPGMGQDDPALDHARMTRGEDPVAQAAPAAPKQQKRQRSETSMSPIKRPDFNQDSPETWKACPCGSGKKFKHCHGKV